MLKYLSKFVLEAMPSIVATVIGAYIVANYINPRTHESPKAAAVSVENPASSEDKTAATATISDPSEAKGVDAKAADIKAADIKPTDALGGELRTGAAGSQDTDPVRVQEKARETEPKTELKTKPAEAVRPMPASRLATRAPTAGPAANDEKKDANDLARAAIERLRGTTERGRTVEAQPTPVPRVPAAVPAAVTTVAVAPPLPPPVIVAVPNYGRRPVGPDQDAGSLSGETTASTDPSRPVPPAEIPVSPSPFEMRARAPAVEQVPVEQASIADHMLATTKSLFRALTPH